MKQSDGEYMAKTLNEVSRTLAGELDLQKVVQSATDVGTIRHDLIDYQRREFDLLAKRGSRGEQLKLMSTFS